MMSHALRAESICFKTIFSSEDGEGGGGDRGEPDIAILYWVC